MVSRNTNIGAYVLTHLDSFIYRDYIIELFTHADRIPLVLTSDTTGTVTTDSPLYVGKLVLSNNTFFRIESYQKVSQDGDVSHYTVTVSKTGMDLPKDNLLCAVTDPVYLTSGYIANYTKAETIETTIGRLLLNYLVLAKPYGDIIPYKNEIWKSGKLQDEIGDLLLNKKITVDQIKQSQNNMFFFGQMTEIYCPNLTKKSLTSSPKIPELKKQLLKEHAEGLAAGDSVTMATVESKLIAADKEYLKDDPASLFLIKGKYWNIVRKKLFLTHGMVERFGQKGVFDFIPNSLEEGWTQEAAPAIFNETRNGSYSRAMETAGGGARAKEVLRVFQNTRVVENDCGTKRGLVVLFAPYNSSEYVYRYANVDGKTVEITNENHKSFQGKAVSVRSPQYCETKNGLCYTCVGKLFQSLGQDEFATVIQSLASAFLTKSLKKAHGTSVDVYEIKNLNDYVVSSQGSALFR